MTKKQIILSLIILIILIIFFIITFYLAISKKPKSYQSKAFEITPEASPSARFLKFSGELDEKNHRLLELLGRYNLVKNENEKQTLSTDLIKEIKLRKITQLNLLPLAPYAVYTKAFDDNALAQFPAEAQTILEKRINNMQGDVKILHEDNFTQNTSRETFFLADKTNPEKNYLFYPTTTSSYPYNPLPFSSPTEIAVKNGLIIDEERQNNNVSNLQLPFSLASTAQAEEQNMTETQSHLVAVEIERISVGKPDSLGQQNLLVLLARYDDIKEETLPNSDEIEASFKKIQDFYGKNSYGRFTLIPEVVKKWYLLERPKEKIIPDDKTSLEFNYIYKNILEPVVKDNIDIERYKNQRFAIVVGDYVEFEHGQSWVGKSSVTDIKVDNNKTISLGQISQAIIYINPKNRSYFYETKPTADGSFSQFEIAAIHESGHSVGDRHAWSVFCQKNTLLPDRPTIINQQSEFDNDFDLDFEHYIRKYCITNEYGNQWDAMGNGVKGLHFNAYAKKYFDWIGNDSNGKYIRIDPNNPDGVYALKLMGENGIVAAWFPFAEANPDDFLRVDYFLEYRKRDLGDYWDEEGLAINIEMRHTPPVLQPTFFFSRIYQPNVPKLNKNLFQTGEYFIDNWNNICVKVKDINPKESSLTFAVASRGKKQAFHLIPDRAGNNNISSINIFESDLQNNDQKSMQIKERLITENPSLCDGKKYAVDQNSINIKQGMLAVSSPVFDEDVTVKPKSLIDRFFSTAVSFNALLPDETTLSFALSELPTDTENQGPFLSQSLKYSLHLIPTPDEYKNDLEPHLITFSNDQGKEINHLELEKGNIIVAKSNIANNSRKPEDANPSIDFSLKWYIQDEKGNNVIPPFSQPHDGIPPKSIDDANPAVLTWTIPQDLKTGDYKVILDVDWNNKLKNEFNENNNMIWRYFIIGK